MSAPERPDTPDLDTPDLGVLGRVLDGLRALPEQSCRPDDDGGAAAPVGPAVPLPRRR